MPSRIPDTEARQVMLDAGLEPLEPYPGSHTPWPCRCLVCGAEVRPHYSTVKHRGSSCDICARKVRAQSQTIPDDEAVAIMVAAGVEPLVEYPGGLLPWKCRCLTCGKTGSPSLSNVKRGQGACRHCAGKWDTEDNIVLMREHGFEPLDPYPGAHAPWRSRCATCDAEVYPHFSRIKNDGGGCRSCAGQVVDHDTAAAVMRAAGLEPQHEYRNATTPWPCRCVQCGEVVSPTYGSVKGGSGCRVCAIPGFNPTAPARVYLIWHRGLAAAKIGITGAGLKTDRLAIHRQHGWEVFETWDVHLGAQAEWIEDQVLSWWREELGAPQAVSSEDMPQNGETETASLLDVDLDATSLFISGTFL